MNLSLQASMEKQSDKDADMKIALNPKMLLSGELSFTSPTFILKQKAISYNFLNIDKLTRKSSFWSKDTGDDKKSSDKTYEIIDQ